MNAYSEDLRKKIIEALRRAIIARQHLRHLYRGENPSRVFLARAIIRSQATSTFLSVLCEAVERYGSLEILVTDGGSVFRANRAQAIYGALSICKEEIDSGLQ